MSIVKSKNKNLIYTGFLWFFVFFLLPLSVILIYAVNTKALFSAGHVRFTFENFIIIFQKKTAESGVEIVPPVFFIRPEKIRISRRQKEVKNRFGGRIKSTVFEGPDIKLGVDSEELGEVKIEIKNVGSLPNFKQGSNILFYWDQTDGILLEY